MNAAKRVAEPVRRRRRWPALVALVIAAATAGGVAGYLFWWPRELCRRWEARVASADDASLPAAIAGLDRCGRYAIRPLVGLLSSAKPAAADSGEAALDRRIRRIRSGDGQAWSDAAELAEALGDALADAPAESQSRHARLALVLLEAAGRLSIDYPDDESARDRVTAGCESVLRHAQAAVEPAKFVAENAAPLKPPPRDGVRRAGSESGDQSGGRASSIPAELNPAESTGPRGPTLNAPGPLPQSMPAAPVTPQPAAPAEPTPRTAANSAARVNPIRQAGGESTPNGSAVRPAGGVSAAADLSMAALASRTAWSLFADLAGEGQAASMATTELNRRGFRPVEIELGRRFATAAPDDRVRLAESLPFQSGIDVRPWLVHLADDDDPAVRLAVVTIMATTNDPQMLARLRQIALTDSDEAVRLRARKLSDTGRTLR